jgi:transcriptional regulator with XRE-family HTH domain
MQRGPHNVIGSRVRKLRENQGLTQEDLMAKCQIVGLNITRSALGRIETRQRGVADFEVHLIATALKVKVADLFPSKPERIERHHANPGGRPIKGGEDEE